MTNDQPLYFVECDFGKLGKAFLELDRDSNTRREVIENIASGEYRDVITVLECNPVERTCRDVTEEILSEAGERPDDYRTPFTGQDKIDWEHDRARSIAMAE